MRISKAFFVVSLIATALILEVEAAETPVSVDTNRPNVIFIWADNLGYGDVSSYGAENIKTPVIDRLGEEGIRLTQFYVAHTICSPSRAALLTGRQPYRVGITDVLRPDGPSRIPEDEITLAEALRQEGYATMAIGKWHLGDRRPYLPKQHGFDEHFGLPYSMDMLPTLLIRGNEIIERLPGDKVANVTQRFTNAAIEFIDKNRDRPFFIYFAHTIPHPPLNIPKEYHTPGRPIYEDSVEYMDRETGRLLDALEDRGLADNTLVIFSSDNGPMHPDGSTGGMKGRIRHSWEGGSRVPFVARFPGQIPAGRVIDTPVIAYDVFPTLIHLAGGCLPEDRVYDGQDVWPLLTGQGRFKRERPFVWVYDDLVTSVRDGSWKLHMADQRKVLEKPKLYDVDRDRYESKNLAVKHPDVVKRLQAVARQTQDEVPKVWTLSYPVRDPARRPSGIRRK